MNILYVLFILSVVNGIEVDPFIGTLGTGHTFPGATFPFGKVQLSPDTHPIGWPYCSGYRNGDNITRVSHTHLSGTGGGDGYDIGLAFETIQPINEIAHPGYYELQGSKNENIKLTVSKHCGWSKFVNVMPHLDLISAYNWDKHIDSASKKDELNIISGFRKSEGWAHHTVFFSLYQKENNVIVCISHSNANEALKHIHTEKHKSFEFVLRETTREWNKHLSLLIGKPILQTALYHTLIHPSLYNETQYTVFSTWDTYRAWNTLMTILYPEYIQFFAQSMMRSKYLPIWELWGNDTQMMGGTHSISMIGEYVLKGLIPVELVWDKIQQSLYRPDRYYDEYYEHCYISEESSEISGSMTLEHSYTDNVLQQIQDKYNLHSHRKFQPTSFTNLFDETMFKPRYKNGKFKQTFLSKAHINNGIKTRSNGFEEGSAQTYRFMAAHDFKTMLSLYQSDTTGCSKYHPCVTRKDGAFKKTLDKWFQKGDICGTLQDFTHCIGQYVQSNEPTQYVPYLYTMIGYPEKTCQLIQQIGSTFFSEKKDGIPGNDDAGQMSAWLIFAAMGFYPVNPSSNIYILGCPAYKEDLVVGKMKITRNGIGNNPTYYWNNNRMDRLFLTHDEVINGGWFHVELA